MKRISHWIDGQLTPGESGPALPVHNPATGEQTGATDRASAAEVDAAVSAAKSAAARWRQVSLPQRAGVLFAFRQLVQEHADELAALVTAEHGKVHSDALGEVARGLENVEFACGVPQLLKGGYSQRAATGVDVHSVRQPLGVVAGITPFNFPVMVPLWMCANAIACGNAFVLKPSEKDPSASLLLAALWQQAGLPDGVFSVVQGDREAVDALLDHADVAAVSFVGSTPVARYIYERGAARGKRVQALGGAKNHALVLPDADLDLAADALVSAAYGSAGERCMALSVAVAVGDVADPLVEALAVRLPKLVVGDGATEGVDMGPLITGEHRDRVSSYVEAGARAGAEVVVDGREGDHPRDGYFLGATLLDRVTPDMTVYRDEIFGPVLGVVRVDTFDDGLALINANPYANGTAVFTRDGGAARRFEDEVEVGMVGINVPIPVPVAYYSFGGWKDSLFGDTHMYGEEGISFYTRSKVVTSRWPDPASSSVDLGFPRNR
ncbi:MAG TPA: CoA-acylating methylmalonate-semialdehyde dehydrogenase [Marmoricola sp.]|jgi:malonate-semialdehyde dehydrogenase (acetylating)/methylmalonate-semialdehyde dehydrogenase|nr:CoA-acylating methylmalonate-semialdehyde dehydrogenase [Marmoricola sp.]